MGRRVTLLLVMVATLALSAACDSSSGVAPTRAPAADLGLARKGLSPSEVDLPCSLAESEVQLNLVSCRVFRHMGETVHVLGEVENTGGEALGEVAVKITGYTDGGAVTSTATDRVYIEPVSPGEKSPYRVFFNARDAVRIEVALAGQPSDVEPLPTLEISDVTLSEPSSGYSRIKGTVSNPGSDPVDVTLIGVLRDEDGEAVEVHRVEMIDPVPPGTSSFEVLALAHGAQAVDVSVFVRPSD